MHSLSHIDQSLTSMSVLFIVGPKCTLAALYAVSWRVTASMPTGQTDVRTDTKPLHYAFR